MCFPSCGVICFLALVNDAVCCGIICLVGVQACLLLALVLVFGFLCQIGGSTVLILAFVSNRCCCLSFHVCVIHHTCKLAVHKPKQTTLCPALCRNDHHLRLTTIPTLMRWTRDGPGARIGPELEAATSTQQVDILVSRFIQQTSII